MQKTSPKKPCRANLPTTSQRQPCRRREYKTPRAKQSDGLTYGEASVALTEALYGAAICADTADQRTRNCLKSSKWSCPVYDSKWGSLNFKGILEVVRQIDNALWDSDCPTGRLSDASTLRERLAIVCESLCVLVNFDEVPHFNAKQARGLYKLHFNACTFGILAEVLSDILLEYPQCKGQLQQVPLLHDQWTQWRQEGVLEAPLLNKAAPSYL